MINYIPLWLNWKGLSIVPYSCSGWGLEVILTVGFKYIVGQTFAE